MSGQRAWLFKGAFFCLAGLSWATCNQAHAQALTPAQSGSALSFGLGYLPQAYSHGLALGPIGHRPDSHPDDRKHGKPEDLGNRDREFNGHRPARPGLCLRAGGHTHDPGPGRAVHALDGAALAGAGHWSAQWRPARGAAGGGNGQQRQDRRSCGGRPSDCGAHPECQYPGGPGRAVFQSGNHGDDRQPVPTLLQPADAPVPPDGAITRIRLLSI